MSLVILNEFIAELHYVPLNIEDSIGLSLFPVTGLQKTVEIKLFPHTKEMWVHFSEDFIPLRHEIRTLLEALPFVNIVHDAITSTGSIYTPRINQSCPTNPCLPVSFQDMNRFVVTKVPYAMCNERSDIVIADLGYNSATCRLIKDSRVNNKNVGVAAITNCKACGFCTGDLPISHGYSVSAFAVGRDRGMLGTGSGTSLNGTKGSLLRFYYGTVYNSEQESPNGIAAVKNRLSEHIDNGTIKNSSIFSSSRKTTTEFNNQYKLQLNRPISHKDFANGFVMVVSAGNNGQLNEYFNLGMTLGNLETNWCKFDGSKWVRSNISSYGTSMLCSMPLDESAVGLNDWGLWGTLYVDKEDYNPIFSFLNEQNVGTSWASPSVAGLMSLGDTTSTGTQKVHALARSCHLYPNWNWDIGFGIPDACKYLDELNKLTASNTDFLSRVELISLERTFYGDSILATIKITPNKYFLGSDIGPFAAYFDTSASLKIGTPAGTYCRTSLRSTDALTTQIARGTESFTFRFQFYLGTDVSVPPTVPDNSDYILSVYGALGLSVINSTFAEESLGNYPITNTCI